MSDLKDRILEEKLIVILRGLSEEKLIATVDILKNMGMHFFELAIDNESELSMEKSLRNIEGLRKHYGDSVLSVLFEEITVIDGKEYLTGYTPQYVRAALPVTDREICSRMAGNIFEVQAEGFVTDEALRVKLQEITV